MALAADNFRKIETHLLQSAEIKRQTAAKCAESIAKAADLISGSFLLAASASLRQRRQRGRLPAHGRGVC